MKKWALLIIAILFLATLQLVWPVFLSFFNCKPDLLLIFSLSLVFYINFKAAFLFTVFAGLLKDSFLPQGPQAMNTVLFALWAYSCHRLSRQIATEDDYVRLGIIFIVAFLHNIVFGVQGLNSGVPAGIFLRSMAISSVYTAGLSPFIFKLAKKITA